MYFMPIYPPSQQKHLRRASGCDTQTAHYSIVLSRDVRRERGEMERKNKEGYWGMLCRRMMLFSKSKISQDTNEPWLRSMVTIIILWHL